MRISFLVTALLAPIVAFAGDSEWTSGWGQGVSEAWVTQGAGNQIMAFCDNGGTLDDPAGVRFMIGGDSPKGDRVTLVFDNQPPIQLMLSNGTIPSNCHACMSNYEKAIEMLKQHSRVHVLTEAGETATFTLRGSREAISDCVPGFAR